MKIKNLLLLISLSATLSACWFSPVTTVVSTSVQTALDPRGASTVVSDKALGSQVNAELLTDVTSGSFCTVAYDNEVLLAGQVPDEKTKESAIQLVSKTQGVKLVYNFLTIESNQSTASIATDAYLTSRAKTEIVTQKGLSQLNTKVVTCDSIVYILGKNPGTESSVEEVIVSIKQISGIKSVVNLISSYKPVPESGT